MLIVTPLVENLGALLRFADGIKHIAVALAVYRLLECLYTQAQVYLIGGDILTYGGEISGLDAVQKDKEGENLVKRASFSRAELGVISHVGREVNLLRNPEIIHRLAVPTTHPSILHVIEVVEVGGIAVDDAAGEYF